MDFWSRLVSHTLLSSGSSRQDFAKDPAHRLHQFEKEYSLLLQTWRASSKLAHDEDAAETIEIRLQEMTKILSDESLRPLPHPCIAFAAAKQIYVPVTMIATTSYNEWIIKEAVFFFATLIESEEEAFVENDRFSSSLTNLLVRITGVNSIRLGSDTESRVVELAFNITTKIRLDPDILPAWFKASHQGPNTLTDAEPRDGHDKFTGKTQKQDFPLFYLLIDYIHHEGKVGDFARTGLLYIIEAASHSVDLEQWIVESDLSTLMATGLGALYSQLSRKLVIDHPSNHMPPVLAFSDYQHPKTGYEVVNSCSEEFQAHMDTFLSHLLFWQDVLNHCRSIEVKSTLLEHFHVIFLQQLLYPSLLESSDVDGGSSVAVLTYLRCILESVDHPDMINLILHYLLALPDIVPIISSMPRSSVSAARKRKSMDLASMMASKSEITADPLLFSLVDLILGCLRSSSHQTIYITLQLVSVILRRHHRYAVITLLYTEAIHSDHFHRTSGAHQQEIEFLMSLASTIGGQDDFNQIYENVVKDTMARLESHPCSFQLLAPKSSVNNHKLPATSNTLPGAPRDVNPHTIRPDDPLLNIIIDRLQTFFMNPVETNLSLTETIFDLATCGFVCIEGWFLRNPQRYLYDDEDNDQVEEKQSPPSVVADQCFPNLRQALGEHEEQQRVQSARRCRRRPKWQSSNLPRLMCVLQSLVDEVSAYRETIPRFEHLLQQRREAFLTADAASTAPTAPQAGISPGRGNGKSPNSRCRPVSQATGTSCFAERLMADERDNRSASPVARGAAKLEGFAQRLLLELGGGATVSPWGRKEASLGQASRSGTSLPGQPGRTPAAQAGPESPTGSLKSVLQGHRSNSPKIKDHENAVVESQCKAFQAIDQSILAQQVGQPRRGALGKTKAIPLSFERTSVASNGARKSVEGSSDHDSQKPSERELLPLPSSGEPVDDASSVTTKTVVAGSPDEAIPEQFYLAQSVDKETGKTEDEHKTVSVSHLLTNVLILQAFLFELASLVQVRAGLFDEVRFA